MGRGGAKSSKLKLLAAFAADELKSLGSPFIPRRGRSLKISHSKIEQIKLQFIRNLKDEKQKKSLSKK